MTGLTHMSTNSILGPRTLSIEHSPRQPARVCVVWSALRTPCALTCVHRARMVLGPVQTDEALRDEELAAVGSQFGSLYTTCITLFSAFLGTFDLTVFDPLPDLWVHVWLRQCLCGWKCGWRCADGGVLSAPWGLNLAYDIVSATCLLCVKTLLTRPTP